jgi:hypothetical protein
MSAVLSFSTYIYSTAIENSPKGPKVDACMPFIFGIDHVRFSHAWIFLIAVLRIDVCDRSLRCPSGNRRGAERPFGEWSPEGSDRAMLLIASSSICASGMHTELIATRGIRAEATTKRSTILAESRILSSQSHT